MRCLKQRLEIKEFPDRSLANMKLSKKQLISVAKY